MRLPVALSAAAVLAAGGCAPEMNWREVRTAESSVSQLFPCRPMRQQRQLLLAGRQRLMVLHVCDAGGTSWAQASCEVDDAADADRVTRALSEAVHANLGAAQALLPRAGTDRFWIRGRSPGGHDVDAAVRIFSRGARAIQITAMGARLNKGDAETFLDSVRPAP